MVVLSVFTIGPILYSGYLSLLHWDGFSADRAFAGVDNYVDLWRSGELGNSLKVTAMYTLGVSLGSLVAGLFVALLIDHVGRGASIYRAVYFLPAVAATVAVSVVWKLLLDPNRGYVNTVLRGVGIAGPNWLRSEWALPAVMVVGIWRRIGFNTVVFLAGLRSIGDDVNEAATIDGAGTLRRLVHHDPPARADHDAGRDHGCDRRLLGPRPGVRDDGWRTGRPNRGPRHPPVRSRAFRYFDIGGASAIGWVVFAVIAGMTGVQWRVFGSGRRGIT